MSLLEMVLFCFVLFCCLFACLFVYLFACLLLHKDTLAIHGYYIATYRYTYNIEYRIQSFYTSISGEDFQKQSLCVECIRAYSYAVIVTAHA